MIFFDILVYLAVAKIAVLLLEDAAYAVRGKQSPRRQARARLQAAAQKAAAGDGAAGTAGAAGAVRSGSTVAAADGYLAGLIEDATERARARRRRAVARKRGAQAVDGVVVDVDHEGRWYADCDLCGWSSRPYRIEANAKAAGREHTRTEHPDQYSGEQEPTQDSAGRDSTESAESADSDGGEAPRRWTPRVIPGGAQDTADTPEPAAEQAAELPTPTAAGADKPAGRGRGPMSSVVHDTCFYCSGCPKCRPPRFGWRCGRCGARDESFDSFEAAEAASVRHACSTPAAATDPDATTPAGPPSQADQTSGTAAGDDQHHPAADPATGTTSSTTDLKEMTVNLEATGPEEIRAAFTQAAEAAGENAETIGGVAGVLTEAADRYEGLEMAASTVGHLRDAAEQFASAAAALNTAQEELQAALADFNAKDGQVAEAVADAGGNVAAKEVLVG
ncbi:hypothetical protein Vqi01_34740 [Micromonospora qiuiae]|uniref:Uncharacterized protein n=1 Tax=Micromonospora qiuiae TaxID=502268 RepID=A0ABQ4JDS8_9ACTN|nr:hypothetical protein [Micromonospora qiuiae]GIJ28312.1 hypothetical protein Vqi01_34740 [Micromonospora qiuiae]